MHTATVELLKFSTQSYPEGDRLVGSSNAKEIAESNRIDAMQWVCQEAKAIKLMGTELPKGSRLREALKALDRANVAILELNLPA